MPARGLGDFFVQQGGVKKPAPQKPVVALPYDPSLPERHSPQFGYAEARDMLTKIPERDLGRYGAVFEALDKNRVQRPIGASEPPIMGQPWADSVHTAIGYKPSAVGYIGGPTKQPGGDDVGEILHAVQGLTKYSKANPNAATVELRGGLPQSDFEKTYVHELGHVGDRLKIFPRLAMGPSTLKNFFSSKQRDAALFNKDLETYGKETRAELLKLAYAQWSGRKATAKQSAEFANVDAKQLTPERITALAEQLRTTYDSTVKSRKR